MNPPDEPLSDRVLDELLSADLDGELQRAADDLGLALDAASEAIASPDAAARRAALAGARGRLAAPVELDPDAADRLVTTALSLGREENELAAARRRRERRADTARRVVIAAGSAAAVIAVIVGLAHLPSQSNEAKSSSSPALTEGGASRAGAQTSGLEFGDVADQNALRRRVRTLLDNVPTRPESTPSATSADALAPTIGKKSSEGSFDSNGSAVRQAASCAAVAQRAAAAGSPPVLRGSGVSRGRPVYVFVFRRDAAYDVFVVDEAGCSVISRFSVR